MSVISISPGCWASVTGNFRDPEYHEFSAVLRPHPQKSKQTNKINNRNNNKVKLKSRKLCGLGSVATIHIFRFPLFQIQSCSSPLSTLKTAPYYILMSKCFHILGARTGELTAVISALRRLRQEYWCEFESGPDYRNKSLSQKTKIWKDLCVQISNSSFKVHMN